MLSRLTTQRLLVVILFILLFAMAVRIPVDTDTWWHLRSGSWILDNHAVPQTDPFSLTRDGQPWIDQSWLSQLVMLAFYRGFGGSMGAVGDGGSVGLALYTALMATAGMAFVFATMRGNVYLRAFVAVLSAATAAVFWSARPQMMSFLLSTITLYLLYHFKYQRTKRVWLIPILMIVWVNLHSGFAIGFIFVGGFIAGETLGRIFDRDNPDGLPWRQIGTLVVIALLSVAALLINPYTTQMLTYPFRTAGIGSLQQYIQEWSSPNFHERETWPFLVMLFGTFAAVGLSRRRIDWTDLLITCGTAAMALYWQRNFAVFAVAAAPTLSRHLSYILDDARIIIPKARPVRGAALVLNWTLLILVLVGAGLKVYVALNPKTLMTEQVKALPVKTAAYLVENRSSGPLFNSYNWGGYLLWAAPDLKVFADGRTDLYDDQILGEWRTAYVGQDWRKTFEKWGIRLVVVEKDAPIATILKGEPGWKEAYMDDQSVIYEKIAT